MCETERETETEKEREREATCQLAGKKAAIVIAKERSLM